MSTLCLPNTHNNESIEFDLVFDPNTYGYDSYIIDYDVPTTFTDNHTQITDVSNLLNKTYGVGFNLILDKFVSDSVRPGAASDTWSARYTNYAYGATLASHNNGLSVPPGNVLLKITSNSFTKVIKLKEFQLFKPIKFSIAHQSGSALSINEPVIVNNPTYSTYMGFADGITQDGILASITPCYLSNYKGNSYKIVGDKIKDIRIGTTPYGSFKYAYNYNMISNTSTDSTMPASIIRTLITGDVYTISGVGDLTENNIIHIEISYITESLYSKKYIETHNSSIGIGPPTITTYGENLINKDKQWNKNNFIITNLITYRTAHWSETSTGSKSTTTRYLYWNATCSLCISNISEKDNFYLPFFSYILPPDGATTNLSLSPYIT